MEDQERAQLEGRIRHVRERHTAFANDAGWDEMLKIIHRPGWTTPAEFMLVLGAMDHLAAQVEAIQAFQASVLAASQQVR